MVSVARRLLGPLIVLGLILALAGCGSDDDKDGGVSIPDEALQRVVRQTIGKFEGPITAADLEGITSLTTSSLGTPWTLPDWSMPPISPRWSSTTPR